MENVFRIIVISLFFGLVPLSAYAASIRLQVETPTGSLYSGTLSVSACPVTNDPATTTVSAKCALEQAGLNPQWSTYGDDLFLSAAGGASEDFANNLYWGWWSGLEYGQVALNKHELQDNESLLVALGVFPLRIGTPTAAIVGATTTVTVEEFGFDSNFNGVWTPSVNAAVSIQGTAYQTSALGTVAIVATSTDPMVLTATKNNLIAATLSLTPTNAPAPVVASGGNGGSGGGTITHPQFNIQSALSFLVANQRVDGSFDSFLLSDWAALAFSAADPGPAKTKLRDYLMSATPTLSSVTDYARHAMALEALGINPYFETTVDYISPIVRAFDGIQIGDSGRDNDDIFALFPLMAAGYGVGDQIIAKTVAFILTRQGANGSWDGSVDLTAAAIQALTQVQSLPNVPAAIALAKNYVHSTQQASGGFGNGFSTSWVLQAISALGEPLSAWASGAFTPQDYVARLQQLDGGVEPGSSSLQTRVWATAYAIPAALGKPWPALLQSFPKQVVSSVTASTPLATSTPVVATTTDAVTVVAVPTPVSETKAIPRVLSVTRTVPQKQSVVVPDAFIPVLTQGQPAAAAGAPISGLITHLLGSIAAFFSRLL